MEVQTRKKRPLSTAGGGLSHGVHNDGFGSSSSSSAALLGLASTSARSLNGGSGKLGSTLSMYDVPPQSEITLDQFERAGIDRLQALKQLESLRLKKGAALSKSSAMHDTTDSPIASILHKYNLDHPVWDNLSHFVLRLAYCKSEELRRWMITQEAALFKYRFDSESEENISTFLTQNDLNYQPLDQEEMDAVMNDEDEEDDWRRMRGSGGDDEEMVRERRPTLLLRDLLRAVPFADPQQTIYYKVPFEDAIDLLGQRKVYLRGGWAYVSRTNLSAIIMLKFRAKLSLALGQTCRATSLIKQDARITPLVNVLSKAYITPSYNSSKVEGAVTKEQLPALAERSFPLCMSNLFGALRSEHHLRHGGRMQLGLFLKGIGLSLADALAFWKSSFARRTPPEKFDKEYAYNIRHNYGKEGKRTTYTPYGCIKIIQSTPGPGDHHGCPFRHFDEAHLRVKLRGHKCTTQQVDEIMSLVKGHHYQIACQRLYQYTHGGVANDAVGNHPNAYFDASESWWKEQQQGQPQGQQQQQGATAGVATNQVNKNGMTQPNPNMGAGVYNAIPTPMNTGNTGAHVNGTAAASTPTPSPPPASNPSSTPLAASSSSAEATPMDISRPDSPTPSSSTPAAAAASTDAAEKKE